MSTAADGVLPQRAAPPQVNRTDTLVAAHAVSQRTVAATAVAKGFGFWSGKDVRVEFRPAPVGSGIVFVRNDLPDPIRIPASVVYRIEAPRRTTLSRGGASVEMIEHVMAALAGLSIDNCEIWVDQSEMPGCDGSSKIFVDAIDSVGVVEQNVGRRQLIVTETTRVGTADEWIEASPSRNNSLSIRYRLDYSERSAEIGRQTHEMVITPDSFRSELADSRTFMLEEEAKWLLAQGLGTRVKPTDVVVFGEDGPVENELRFDDECVRHKMLDVVGDLALAGYDVIGQIVAHRSGHRLNAELVKALLKEGKIIQAGRNCA